MRTSFHESLKELKNHLLVMGSMVENAINNSILALKDGDLDLARKVIEKDERIDDFELVVEERCTRLIALQQPVANDLRMIIVISKIITDLERMGDHAVNIAEKVIEIDGEELLKPLSDIPQMANIAIKRLQGSLDAFVKMDIDLAKKVAREDEKIDLIDKESMGEAIAIMLEDQTKIKQATALMFVSRFLERIGDHATNICERVIYMVSGYHEHY
ncbi:phosphate signaling complex protein PhoU [Natronospora cellulosivora (SeqCode)]